MNQHDMPEEHVSLMLGMLKIPYGGELPRAVRDTYEIVKIAADRVQLRLNDHDLLWILVRSGVTIPGRHKTVIDLFREGQLKIGSPVLCEWRKEKNKEAVLIRVNANGTVTVRFVGKPDEYQLTPDKVAPAEVPVEV